MTGRKGLNGKQDYLLPSVRIVGCCLIKWNILLEHNKQNLSNEIKYCKGT